MRFARGRRSFRARLEPRLGSGFHGGVPVMEEELVEVGAGPGRDLEKGAAETSERVDTVSFGALDKREVGGACAAFAFRVLACSIR